MDILEVEELKRHIEEEFKKDTDAIDRVLALLAKKKAADVVPNGEQSPTKSAIIANNPTSKNTKDITSPATLVDKTETNQALKTGNESQPKPFGRVRDTGVRGVAKQIAHLLPETFLRKDVVRIIEENHPEMKGKLTVDAMSGAMQRLVDDGFIELKEKSHGKKPAIYRRLEN